MTGHPGNSRHLWRVNRLAVLNMIKENEPVSRRQLAKATGLTPPAITGIVRDLLEAGFVREVGLGRSDGGRKPVKLRLNPEAGYVVGVEVTRQETAVGMADLMHMPQGWGIKALDMSDPDAGIGALADAVCEAVNAAARDGRRVLGVGVAFPGLLDIAAGEVVRSINLGPAWRGIALRQRLTEKIGLPVFIENNSNAAALAERWFGSGKECRDLAYLNLGEGISAGVILGDQVVQGFRGHAGEVGHTVILEDGPRCNCGNRGCLEAICGLPALQRRLTEKAPRLGEDDPLGRLWRERGAADLADAAAAAAAAGGWARKFFQEIGHHIGIAVANIINHYNPEVVFLGGKLAAMAGTVLLGTVIETAHRHAFPEVARETRIALSALGSCSGYAGACALALRELFQSPRAEILAWSAESCPAGSGR